MPDGAASKDFSVTTGSLPASKKIHVQSPRFADVKVAMREIALDSKTEAPVQVYDTSGPYSDPDTRIDIRKGLNPLRSQWIRARGDVEEYVGRTVQPLDNGIKGARQAASEGICVYAFTTNTLSGGAAVHDP